MDTITESMENSTIRVDTATQQGSVLDVVRMVLQCSSGNANNALRRLQEDCAELTSACSQLRINGKGKLTPVADAKTLVEIVFLLPGKIARDFRRKSAAKVCRLLGGDSTLVAEIEQRRAQLENSADGRATRSFLLGGSPDSIEKENSEVEAYQGMPLGFCYLGTGDRQVVAKQVVELSLERERNVLQQQQQDLKRQRCSDMVDRYTSLRDIGVELDPRTMIEIRDNVSLLTKRDLAIEGTSATSTAITQMRQDPKTPTHVLGQEQRGHETGIVVVAAKMGVRVPAGMSGSIGKLMKSLYKKKYDLPADWDDFVKRQTLFHGRPILENCYYQRDEDIVMEAIRIKMNLSQ